MSNSRATLQPGERSRVALLGIGLAVAVAFLAWVMFAPSLKSGLLRTLSTSLIYALPMVFISVSTMPLMRRYVDTLRFPWDTVVFLVVMSALAVVSITLSSGLMVLAGFASAAHPWDDLRLMNRLSFSMIFLFSTIFRVLMVARLRFEERKRALEEKVEQSTRERLVLDQDMQRAWDIQQALFPKDLPKLETLDVAAGCQPARVVGGDYYDVIRLKDGRLAIAIADVVGKGMAAALLMSNLQAIVRSFAPEGVSPAELCAKANKVMSGNIAPGKFITFFYAVVEADGLRADYCNAGHNPPILVHENGGVELLKHGGPLLGVLPDAVYETGRVGLNAQDKLVLFTDGITEAAAIETQEFGEERLVEVVKTAECDAQAVKAAVMQAVRHFAGESLQDDATLVVLTMAGAKAATANKL